jgi:DNA-binding response OmpR family regulator
LNDPTTEILLVEDSEDDAQFLMWTLRLAGVRNHVRWINDATIAKTHLSQVRSFGEAPGILLFDLKLGDSSGFELLEWLRGSQVFDRSLKIVITTAEDLASIKRAYALGAASFLSKPVEAKGLLEVVEAFPGPWLRF